MIYVIKVGLDLVGKTCQRTVFIGRSSNIPCQSKKLLSKNEASII